jgi:hypothetical protein
VNRLHVIGGQQKYLCPVFSETNWAEYHKGIIIQIDTETGDSTLVMDYSSPEQVSPLSGAILFKAASLKNGLLYLCTETEILIYRYPEMTQAQYISLPILNDAHHVTKTPWGTLAVANSGLEMVLELNKEGNIVRTWNALAPGEPAAFSSEIDYRKVNLKPHKSHPNYVFFHDEEMWVTRFYQKDAVSLTCPGRRIDIAAGSPHDGIVHGDFTYFTTVNGHIVIANNRTLNVEDRVDLNKIHNHGGPLGWARGIYVDGPRVWVGFSRIRPTKLKENLEWVKHTMKWRMRRLLPENYKSRSHWMHDGPKNELPTRLICYDFTRRHPIREINLEPHGISAVFSIIPAETVKQTQPETISTPIGVSTG